MGLLNKVSMMACLGYILVQQAGFAQLPEQQPSRLHWKVTPKPWREWVMPGWPETTKDHLTTMEHQLYNQTYPADSLERRVQRLEHSLGIDGRGVYSRYQKTDQSQQRLATLKRLFDETQQQPVNQKNRADIGLLENRILQQRFDQWAMPQRLAQLENLTFGQVFETEPDDKRLERLFEQIPLNNRAVRFVTGP
jgi:hypothetical protein